MRLSNVLSNDIDNKFHQVENFIGYTVSKKIKTKDINIGKIIKSFHCKNCDKEMNFLSSDHNHCTVINEKLMSIDAVLNCCSCETPVPIWFIIECENSFYFSNPNVKVKNMDIDYDNIVESDSFFKKSILSFEKKLYIGAVAYLRVIMENLFENLLSSNGINFTNDKGKKFTFKQICDLVESELDAIPNKINKKVYKLFSELSEGVHGNMKESDIETKYNYLMILLVSIIKNIENNKQVDEAIKNLNWVEEGVVV